MTEIALKRSAGLFMLAIHLVSVLLVIALFFMGGFTFEQMTTALATIGPMFAGIATQIVTYFTESRFVVADRSRHVTAEFRLITFGFPAILGLLVWGATIAQANGAVFSDFEQYKMILVVFEGIFAAYIARTMTALFGGKKATLKASKEPTGA
jgi:hypothetical protein